MSRVPSYRVEDNLSTTIASLVTTQEGSRLSPSYRPLIGTVAFPTFLPRGGEPELMMCADGASIEAVFAAGGEVRLIPIRPAHREEDAIDMVLQAVLPFDGLLFAGCPCTVDSLLDWWSMLMTLVARETLTPVFGICGGAGRLNMALGGTLQAHRAGSYADEGGSDSLLLHPFELDAETLAHCVRGANPFISDAVSSDPGEQRISCTHCMFLQAPDELAPGCRAWGKLDGMTEGFDYLGPKPWFALAALFHAEVGVLGQDPLSYSLFRAFLAACRAYAASLRGALKSTRMRDRILRPLYVDSLLQSFLSDPLLQDITALSSHGEWSLQTREEEHGKRA